jgi:DNA helicase-2/ATP-dependent DNA helicase PcrA
MAYLALLANPQDQVSFTRIANSPRRGLGQTSLSRVLAHATTLGVPVWDVAAAPERVPGLGRAAITCLGRFMGTMGELRSLAQGGAPIGDLLDETLRRSGYFEALEAERTFEAQGRLENLEELVGVAREFDATAEERTLDAFLQQVALVSDADTRVDDQGLVTLMTLHNAKGLEYPIVFIIGCEEGIFPHSRSLDEGSLEEERRLCYVGITRAMRDLTFTYARRRSLYGTEHYGLRSRFLDELPLELTDRDEDFAAPLTHSGSGRGSMRRTITGAGAGWESAAAAGRRTTEPAVSYRLGEDVIHAAFGDGVVTALEPGGIVVVRFARDGSERKLLDSAPMSRR